MEFLKHLKISRPGLWFPTLWLYVLPLSSEGKFWLSPLFWVGLFFVSFPLNYFVYSLNDYGDVDADKNNERKGNFLFGAKESKKDLLKAVRVSTIVLLCFGVFFTWIAGYYITLLFAAIVVFNFIYNFSPTRLKSRPPFELFIQVGYILTGYLSVVLNNTDPFPWQTILYLVFFCFQAHLAGEIMDIEPDKKAGKVTTATTIGRINAKILMIVFLIIEVAMLAIWFNDYVLAGTLGVFALWMVADTFIIYKDKEYSLFEMKLFGLGMNAIAFASMLWILYSGKLMFA